MNFIRTRGRVVRLVITLSIVRSEFDFVLFLFDSD